MIRRPAVLALLVAILASACGATAPTPTPAPADGLTAWERALQKDDDGSRTKDQALALFATAFGPLPGVDVQQDLTGVHDRTIAILAVARFRDELTEEQRQAIDRAMVPPADATIIEVPQAEGGMVQARLVAATASSPLDTIRQLAGEYRRRIAGHLGFDVRGNVVMAIAETTQVKDPMGEAWNYDLAAGQPCRINIYSSVLNLPGPDLRSTIAHELIHCFQFHGFGSADAAAVSPDWVMEGQAEWGGALFTDAGSSGGNWQHYLWNPRKPLTARDYDAIGFYAHLAESGVDPWSTFKAMWAAGGNSLDAFLASGADSRQFLESWASSVVRQPGRGRPWDTTGPSVVKEGYPYSGAFIDDGVVLSVGRPAFTNDVVELRLNVDFVHIVFDGDARLNDRTIDTTDLKDAWFCVAGRDCKKPCSESGEPPPIQGTIQSPALLATTGGIARAEGYVEGANLAPCKSPRPSGPPDDPGACGVGCGEALGDVHLVTVAKDRYDFQGVGEFVMLRSTDGSFEVQARMRPYGRSRTVSIVTALAVRVGDRRVTMYADVAFGTVRVAVDGQDVDLREAVDLGAGNRLVPDPDGVHVEMADGGYLAVLNLAGFGMNLIARPPDAALPGIAGLMGPAAPGSDLPALADGTALPPALNSHEAYVALYDTFASSWRITQAGSLFDYEPGTSTETFTDREFPLAAELRTLEELTPAERAAGEAACRDVTDKTLHAMCVYDVGVTADAGFGAGYVKTAQLIAGGTLPSSGDLVRIVNLYSNTDGPLPLDVYAWIKPADAAGDAQATLVGTVPYGSAGEFFDPGTLTGNTGEPANRVSVQRAGEPLNEFQFNLYDLERPTDPGSVRTMVIRDGDAAGLSIVGGRPATMDELYEASPKFYIGLQEAPAGKGLLFANIDPLYYDRPDSELYVAAGSGCLAYPDFPTFPIKLRGIAGPTPLVVEPGTLPVTVHDAATGPDPAPGCTTPSAVAPVTAVFEPGGRSHLFVYVTPGDPTLKALLVPFRG